MSKMIGAAAHAPGVKRASWKFSVLRTGACALYAALAAACGTAPEPLAGPADDLSVRRATGCVVEAFPQALPGAAALVDTAELSAGVRALLADAGVSGGEAVLTLWYEPDGLNVRRDLLRYDLPVPVADSLQQMVFAALHRAPEMERAWGARLHVRVGEQVAYSLSRREYCPPRPRNRTMEADMATYQGTGTTARARGRRASRMVLMEVTVHPAGFVERARILRGATSGGTLEKQIADEMRQYSFVPASLDGVPVQGSLAVPVRLRG